MQPALSFVLGKVILTGSARLNGEIALKSLTLKQILTGFFLLCTTHAAAALEYKNLVGRWQMDYSKTLSMEPLQLFRICGTTEYFPNNHSRSFLEVHVYQAESETDYGSHLVASLKDYSTEDLTGTILKSTSILPTYEVKRFALIVDGESLTRDKLAENYLQIYDQQLKSLKEGFLDDLVKPGEVTETEILFSNHRLLVTETKADEEERFVVTFHQTSEWIGECK
jgi:hypothetical protein